MNEIALITGATSGIGRDFAEIFAKKGYDLFLASRNKKHLDEIKSDLENKYGIQVNILAIDLSKENSARLLFNEAGKQDIQVLINNAGFGVQGEHIDLELSKIESMICLNITTLTHLCSLFAKKMKERGGGYILNVASTGAFIPMPYFATYGATKSYILFFSEAIAKEMKTYNVVVTCLCPGVTDTNFFTTAGVGGKNKGLWANSARMSSMKVAQFGVKALFDRKLSVVPGFMNSAWLLLTRFVSRNMVAKVSKKIIKDSVNVD